MKKAITICFSALIVLGTLSGCKTVCGPCGSEPLCFEKQFKEIAPEAIDESIFKLVGKDYTVITAGKIPHHNAMTASYGGVGILFEKPVTWCFLQAGRFTLEGIRREKTYTFSYFPEQYRDDVIFFGTRSGRDTNKMKESKLTPVATPSGETAYAEAKLVIECRVIEETSVKPDDFLVKANRDFVEDGYQKSGDYHKIVFGEITRVWKKR